MAKRTVNADSPCRIDGCPEPRMVDKHGKPMSYCPQHQRQYWKRQTAKHHQRQRTGEPARRRRQPMKLLLVDSETGRVLRVSGFVDEEVSLDELRGGALHPATEAVFVARGYTVGRRQREA